MEEVFFPIKFVWERSKIESADFAVLKKVLATIILINDFFHNIVFQILISILSLILIAEKMAKNVQWKLTDKTFTIC